MPSTKAKHGSLVKELTAQASNTYVTSGLPLNYYYHAADLLVMQADQYRMSGNQAQLYVMLLRYVSLIVETVMKHKNLKKDDPRYLKHRKQLLEVFFPEVEKLKIVLGTTADPEELVACSTNRPDSAVPLSASNLPEIKWYSSTLPSRPPPTTTGSTPLTPLSDFSTAPVAHSSNALDFLDAAPPAPFPAPTTPAEAAMGLTTTTATAATTTVPYTSQLDTSTPARPSTSTSYSSISHAIVSESALSRHSLFSRPGVGSVVVGPAAGQPAGLQQPAAFSRPAPRYPVPDVLDAAMVPLVPPLLGQDVEAQPLPDAPPLPAPSAGPSLGPQEVQVQDMGSHGADPNGSCALVPATGGVKPYTKKAALRDVQIAVSLLEDFMRLAQANTRRGIESCGILAGVLSANDSSFTITTLIVPKQRGSSDQVEMLAEEEIFDVQMSRELYPLGWIHTHPTQSCFLSSIDIHTQCGYQTMLDEAVAIVMAPTDSRKRCGIFRLSTPGGMELIQKCVHRGFHSHPSTSTGQEIYEFSGHTFLNPRLEHDVVDLR